MKKYALFSGRHDIKDTIEGGLCASFDFKSFRPAKEKGWAEALKELKKGGDVGIYLTGLTPAITQFLEEAVHVAGESRAASHHQGLIDGEDKPVVIDKAYFSGHLYLYHYDKDLRKWRGQRFF